jgi:hypothetical protein
MEQVIKRDDVYEFCKIWNMFDEGHNSYKHCTQGYCAMAVRYNAFKIFEWIVKNRWGYIAGHWDRVWRVHCILENIVAYDRIDMMKLLIKSGENVVLISYNFASIEMIELILHEYKLGKFHYKHVVRQLDLLEYLQLYLFLAQTPKVVQYILDTGIKLRPEDIKRYIEYGNYPIVAHLLDRHIIDIQNVYNVMFNLYNGSRLFRLLIQLREFGYIHYDDLYDETYQHVLDTSIQKEHSSLKEFMQCYHLGANIGELSSFRYNEPVLKYILTHNSQINSKKLVNYIMVNKIGYTPFITTINGYKTFNPDVLFDYGDKLVPIDNVPIFAICNGDYKVVTGDDVCKCYNDTFYNPESFYFLVYLREFGYITDMDTFDTIYQHVLDQLVYDDKECWYKLGGNQGPSHVASYVRFNMIGRLNSAIDLVGYKRVMEWLWGTNEYNKLVKFLRENGYVTNYELIQFRIKMHLNR